jgi:lysophospholipase L1-like esterase
MHEPIRNDANQKKRPLPLIGLLAIVVFLLLAIYVLSSPRRTHRIGFWMNTSRDKGAFVFAGDSIVAGWTNPSAAFPGIKIANRGLNGDGVLNLLARLDADILSLQPRGILLMIGTNDLNSGANPADVVLNVRKILDRVRSLFPSIPLVVCTLTPREPEPGRFPERLREVNAALSQAFAADPFTSVFDSWALFANERGEPSRAEFPDGLHPSPQAYEKWGLALRPLLEKISGVHIAPDRKE